MSWFSRCSWCGGPFNGGNCQHCTNVSFGDESVRNPKPISNDKTPDFSYPPSQPQTSSSIQFHCYGCGDLIEEGVRCQQYTCEWCGSGLSKGFCFIYASKDENSSINVPNPNSFNDPPNIFSHPPQPQTYSCKLCGNDSHYGYDCPPRFPLYHQPRIIQEDLNQQGISDVHDRWDKLEESHNELLNMIQSVYEKFLQQKQAATIDQSPLQEISLQEMEDLKQHYLDEMLSLSNDLRIKDYHNKKIDIHFQRECEDMIDELKGKFNGMSIEINKKIELQRLEKVAKLSTYTTEPSQRFKSFCYDDDDDYDYKENTIPLNEIDSQIPPSNAIAPVLPTKEPDDSLSMRDKHLSTIPEMESDEVINSSVEDLVLILSEFEDLSDNKSECDVPFCDESSTISQGNDSNHFDAESDLLESLLNRDTSIVILLRLILLEEFIEDIHLVEQLLYDNSYPLDALKDHFEIFFDSNDECTLSDGNPFYREDIDYVEASPPNSELVSLEEVKDFDPKDGETDTYILLKIKDDILCEKLLNINLLIAKIESLNDNPTPNTDFVLKSPSLFPIPVEEDIKMDETLRMWLLLLVLLARKVSAKHQLAVKGLFECKASESNIRRNQVKDIVKEVKDYLKTYSSAGMDNSESLSKAWTCFKDLLQEVPHHGIDRWLQIQIFYDHVSFHFKCEIDRAASEKLRNKNTDESWEIIENLALYDHEGWDETKEFVKQVKAISTPQGVTKTPNRRLLGLEDQINFLLKGLLKELTTSRTPEKVLIREETKFPITKNVNSTSLTKDEERGSNRTKVTPDNAEKLTRSDTPDIR
ncbi:hypothetical protein Tco_0879986 [Tanacetum coccineum]